jgi:branched-chain amino acid aminotransferase
MSQLICYVNGAYVALNEAALPVQDLAILRGYGVFDFLRTYHKKPFHLSEHLCRLANSARLIGLDLPHPLETIEAIVRETLDRNELSEANIRIIVSGGVTSDGITPLVGPSLLVLVTPVRQYPPEYYEQGVKVITVEMDRYLPQAKTINYIPAIMALQQAQTNGAVEALYTNPQGHILEGTTTNFFIFQGQQLITPGENILPGVTRDVVLDLARQSNFMVVERPITLADIAQAEEAFITASNKEIMPVNQVNEIRFGAKTVGPHTQRLRQCFAQLVWGGN